MIVEANSVMMMGRQIGGSGGGETAAGAGSAAMPFKKRKFQNRGSLEMSRSTHGTGLAAVGRRPSLDARRGSIEERRLSVDRRRNSLECLAAAAGLETAAAPVPAPTPTARMLPGSTEDNDDASMFPISEGSDEVEEIQPEEEDEVTATFHAGRLISKLFASGDKPSCLKVKGKQTDGFIVNKRFMDVMNRRNQKQAAELERLRQENLALRNAQTTQPQFLPQAQYQFQQPQMHYQQQPSYGHVMGMPSPQPAVYPHQAMQSSLYMVPSFPPTQQAGPSWQYAPAQ